MFLFLIGLSTHSCLSQPDSTLLHRKKIIRREIIVYSSTGVLYGSIGYGLYTAWYKNYPLSKFHFFNDNSEWLQMDKVGHAFTCYAEAVSGINLLENVGLSKNKAIIMGGMIGLGMQTMVEIMDGFSNEWGFSWGDMGANIFGTALAMSQKYYWNDQRIKLCYSFHYSDLNHIRPEILGTGFLARVLKDYNGQTAWVSVNIRSFAPKSGLPPWLNLAIGYSPYNMLTGDPKENNIFTSKGIQYDYSNLKRFRKFYFSPDINLQKIPFVKKHKNLFLLARFLAPLKVPLPTLEFSKNGIKFKAFYF